MKRPKLKKASKRISCAKRYKIQKKVREHHRKIKRDAKKSGIKRRKKKDVGVPNSAPFKEEVLREAEQRKRELEELKEKNRLQKQQERAKKRKKDKEERSAETEPDKKKAKKEAKVKAQRQARLAAAKEKNTKKFRCIELNKVIDASDVILEVLDARDPMGCRCPQLEEAVLNHDGKKRLLFVLNKIDLVPKDNLEKWVEFLQAQCPTFLFKSSTHLSERTVLEKKQRDANGVLDHSRAAASFGRDSLMQALDNLASKKGADAILKVGVVGFPNVGKSCIVNTLKGIRACHAGVQRGLTKCMQEVHISKKVNLIDSPAIVAALSVSGEKIALKTLQVEDKEVDPVEAVRHLLKHCDQQQVMLQYNVPDYRNSLEFLTFLAKKRGYLQKGALPNTEQAATIFLNDWTGAKLNYCCKVPESNDPPHYLTEDMVTQMQAGLDLDRVKAANRRTCNCLRNPSPASTIALNSKDMTDGFVSAGEIPEETSVTAEEDEKEEEQEEDVAGEVAEPEEVEKPKKQQTPKSDRRKTRKQMKRTPSAPVNVDLLAAKQTDDAYDFSTDFV